MAEWPCFTNFPPEPLYARTDSNRDGFFAALQQGMEWIKRREAHHAGQTGVCSSKIEVVEVARTFVCGD
jgi:hypothetical protein